MSKSKAHDLMPEELAKEIPGLDDGECQDIDDMTVHVKWFTPDSSWTWYVLQYDPDARLCYGLVVGVEREFGTFSVAEVEAIRGPYGLRVERDLYFTKRPVSECR